MEQQIRNLCKGLGDVDILRVDSAKASNFKHLIDRVSNSAPTLQGHHPPSYTQLDALDHITFDSLAQDHRHTGKALHVTVTEVKYDHGVVINGKDESDATSSVWSLLLRPFGKPITKGMEIAIKEPYYGRSPNGDLAVCVHHPTDCILVTAPDSRDNLAPTWTPSCSTGHIDIRQSSLAGRGLFAAQPIGVGGLVLLEKTFALSDKADAASYGNGIEGVLQGERTNARKLALLQQLVDKMHEDQNLRKEFFELHAGDPLSRPIQFISRAFDIYRALSIIKHNAHTIIPGNTSDHHDIANKPNRTTSPSATDQTPGIWLQASLFNHSCLPNCTWAWTGNLFVARANRDIAADEELTVAYVPTSYDYEKRQGVLRASNDFECSCPLCKADEAAARTPEMQEAITKSQRLPQHVKGASLQEKVKNAEELVCSALKAYPRSIYIDTDGNELPCVQLAEPFYHLAHIVLDRAKNGHKWTATSPAMRSKAREYFIACVQVGLGYKLVFDPSSPYCELLFLKHSQPRPIGVLALMALAELTFIDGEKERCRALKACAKKLYGIWYGEDASFKKQHLFYSCKDEPADRGKMPASKEWEELKAEKMKESRVPPNFEGIKS